MFYVYSFILKCVRIFDKDSIKQEQRKLVFNLPSVRILCKDSIKQEQRKLVFNLPSVRILCKDNENNYIQKTISLRLEQCK